jgi:hypothetical protein
MPELNFCQNSITRCREIYKSLPPAGLFSGLNWLIAEKPFELDKKIYNEIESLGRVLLQFYRAANFLYRFSYEGKQPSWVAEYLDIGKPSEIIELQRKVKFKNELPRVIRPDLLLTERGLVLTELDSVPGGIGLTAWLNEVYSKYAPNNQYSIIGGTSEMLQGFSSIFGNAKRVKIVVSKESSTYLPEMQWMASKLGEKFNVYSEDYTGFQTGDAVYRFFELFDFENINNFKLLVDLSLNDTIYITPPLKSFLEEKMWFAFLWNRNLRQFWRKELGESFFERLLKIVPYSWIIDPTPLPPQGAYPKIELTDWSQLKMLSQKQRNLILKISGFSEIAWGARGVFLGSDISSEDWAKVVDVAIKSFNKNPYILQEYKKPMRFKVSGYKPLEDKMLEFEGRVRLSPYYFVSGDWSNARAKLCGILATICPSDKKIIHGMKDSVLAPCSFKI